MDKQPLFSVTKKDFVVETFKSGGKGGQHQNKTDSGVRIKHPESGAVGECRDTRSQHRNKAIALKRLVATSEWKTWHRRKCAELSVAADAVAEQLRAVNLKVEGRQDGVWKEIG